MSRARPECAVARPECVVAPWRALDANWHGMNQIIVSVRVQHGRDMSTWITLYFSAHLPKDEKNLLSNGVVYPNLGAHLRHKNACDASRCLTCQNACVRVRDGHDYAKKQSVLSCQTVLSKKRSDLRRRLNVVDLLVAVPTLHHSPLSALPTPPKKPMDGGDDHWWNDGTIPSDDASAED